jgi:predicted DNA-binding transcriptional regulator AlpA
VTLEPGANVQMLKINDVAKLTSLSRSTIYALVDAGRFPRPRRLAPDAWHGAAKMSGSGPTLVAQ